MVILMPLALLGILGLAAVVAIHELAEVIVIGNGIRAGRSQPLPASTAARFDEDSGESVRDAQERAKVGSVP